MKFSASEDIEAPIEWVYSEVTNFAGFEKQALRRGAEVVRLDSKPVPETGSGWDVSFRYRGKTRKLRAKVESMDPPNGYVVAVESAGLDGKTQVELVPLSRHRTRLSVTLEMTPKTLSARLVLQSLKLAKTNLTKRFKGRVADFAEDAEERYRKQS